MSKTNKYTTGRTYTFLVGSGSEPAVYRGVRDGMHRFELASGQLWTGYVAPVVAS